MMLGLPAGALAACSVIGGASKRAVSSVTVETAFMLGSKGLDLHSQSLAKVSLQQAFGGESAFAFTEGRGGLRSGAGVRGRPPGPSYSTSIQPR